VCEAESGSASRDFIAKKRRSRIPRLRCAANAVAPARAGDEFYKVYLELNDRILRNLSQRRAARALSVAAQRGGRVNVEDDDAG
jgi:hypothetical protein